MARPNRTKADFERLFKERKAAALAEYVTMLVLIGGASLGLITKFGGDVVRVFDITTKTLSSNNDGADFVAGGGENATGGGNGSIGINYDPGGGYVVAGDIAQGCPLPEGAEYFKDNNTVQLEQWVDWITDPANPPAPLEKIGPYPMYPQGTYVRIPSGAMLDLYQSRGERFAFTRNFYWNYTGRLNFNNLGPSSYDACSDRSRDGVRAPGDSPAGSSTTSTLSAGAFGAEGSEPTLGYFDHDGDEDWHRIEHAGGPFRAMITPSFVQGRLPAAGGLSINIVDENGATPSGANSESNVAMASALSAGTYFLKATNSGQRYGGMGGYEITAGSVEDTPETYEGAQDIALGDVWEEGLPEGDAGDMFRLVLPENEEVHYVVRAYKNGDTPVQSLTLQVTNRDTGSAGDPTVLETVSGEDKRFLVNHAVGGAKEHFFFIERYYGTAGDYRLTVEQVDDVSPHASRAQELKMGEAMEARIWADNDFDFYRFENTEAQQVRISMANNDYLALEMEFDVYDKDLNHLGSSTSDDVAEIIFDALSPGEYFIKGRGANNGWGDYTILVEGIYDTLSSFENARVLALGDTHNEDIASAQDVDMFRFTNPVDQHVVLAVDDAGTDIQLTLFDSDGVQIDSDHDDYGAQILSNDLPAGDYFAKIETVYAYRSDYTLTLNSVQDARDTRAGAHDLVVGTSHNETIAVRDDVDVFRFVTTAAENIKLEIAGSGEIMDMILMEATGAEIASSLSERAPSLMMSQLPAGEYFIQIGTTYDVRESYTLDVSSVVDAGNTLDTATAFAFGNSHSEDIITVNDVDFYEFTVPVPQDVLMTVTGSSEIMVMTLYDAGGTALTSYYPSYPQTQPRLLVNQMEAGTYRLKLVTRYEETTDYDLFIGPVVDTPSEFEDARTLTLGESYAEAVSTVDDVDAFTFENDAVQSLKIGASASKRFRLRLYDADLNLINDHSSSTLSKSFTTGELPIGTYYLLMSQSRGYTTDYTVYARPAD